MSGALFGVLALAAGWTTVVLGQETPESLARRTRGIFEAKCLDCHGAPGQKVRGNFDYILDFDKLRASPDKINLKEPAQSGLYQRIESDEMPFGLGAEKLTDEEKKTVLNWITAGAPAPGDPRGQEIQVSPASDAYIMQAIVQDMEAIRAEKRGDIRYLSIAHMREAGDNAQDMEIFRDALAKLVNSLSWQEELVPLQAIDVNRAIFRIDLKSLGWKAKTWEELGQANPYSFTASDERSRAAAGQTGSQFPYMRGDWFAHAASRPPFYTQILELPQTSQELELLLGIRDASQDIRERRVLRAGFSNSGVSQNNRMIERNRSRYGAYWKSYDFKDSVGTSDLFSHPLGPGEGPRQFKHAGGEIIFNLPNGLQAYMLVNSQGKRLDEAPIEIVQDTSRRNAVIVNGISCISCHNQGVNRRPDQIRDYVEKNSALFKQEELEEIFATYRGNAKLDKAFDEDEARFTEAMKQAGVTTLKGAEPVRHLADRFDSDVDLKRAAAELGVSQETLFEKAKEDPEINALLSRMNVRGVPRSVFIEAFPKILALLNPDPLVPGANAFGMSFSTIPAGTFQMGSPNGEKDRNQDEAPHIVTLTKGFEMQTTEVTQSQWFKVMKDDAARRNPSRFNKKENCPQTFNAVNSLCPNNPVEQVSWDDIQAFIKKLNETARDGYKYRLPTEAEWEWAARAKTQTAYFFGNDASVLVLFAWFTNNSGKQTHDVTEHARKTNAFGLSDMHGNVWELVEDLYGAYPATAVTDPKGPSAGSSRVVRGGSWITGAEVLRSANRLSIGPANRFMDLGCRLVRSR